MGGSVKMNKQEMKEAIKERIEEIIKENTIEQDNQGHQDIGMINEEGLKRIVEEMSYYLMGIVEGMYRKTVMDIYGKSWKKIGRTEKGEDIYYNLATREVGIEKDYSYLVVPEKIIGEEK